MSVKIQDFAAFGLDDSIMRAIDEMGYAKPTPIQAQAIPQVIAGGENDLLPG